jgi:sec-independent protein translocase protein TatC
MTLIEHLDELRSRILKIGIAFFVAAFVAWFFHRQIFEALLAVAPSLHGKLHVTSVTEQIITDVKLTLYVAFVVTIPVLLYQMWAFVAPAVGEMGRVFTYVLIAMASSLFLAGVAFGYFVVLPVGIKFLLSWDPSRFVPIITPTNYLSFVTRFLLAFGLVFELPAATYVGAKLGVINAPLLKNYRRHAIVINTVLAAALTPGQDPFSMILMAVPMIVMYEVSIIIARYVNPTPEVTAHELARVHAEEDHEPEYEEPDYGGEYEPEYEEYGDNGRREEEGEEVERDL